MARAKMRVLLEIGGVTWTVDTSEAVELGLPLDFYGPQARAFGMSAASARAVQGGDFIGDRRRGGSANCESVELIAHGNGTHTEGVGHITEERISVGDLCSEPFLPAALLTVEARRLGQVAETYRGESEDGDFVICRADLQDALTRLDLGPEFSRTLIIRLAPTPAFPGALSDHSGQNRPYFTKEAIAWLRDVGCDHLLVEIPSIDREEDGGTLPNHHAFFDFERGAVASKRSRRRTITEMIDVPLKVSDGPFACSLRFPRFVSDAAPSRPILYPLEPV